MAGFYYLLPTLFAIGISMLVVRAGAIALMMTGMKYERAKFQALSAFSGTGFTTREAERVVNDPRRRSIITWLIVLGNAGIVTVIVATTTSFTTATGSGVAINAFVLIAGLALLYALAKHTRLARYWEGFVQRQMERRRLLNHTADVDELVHVMEGYGVVRVRLHGNSPFIGRDLRDDLAALDHALVLGIERDGRWTPLPHDTGPLREDDVLVVYGLLAELTTRFR